MEGEKHREDRNVRLRRLHLLTLIYVFFLTLLLWTPDPRDLLGGWEPSEGPRSYAHLITFGLLGFLVESGRRRKGFVFWAALLVLYAFVTEIVQEILPTPRSFEWQDIFQDLAGVFLGMGIGWICPFREVLAGTDRKS